MNKITTEEFESFLAECTGKIEHKDLEAWRKAAFAFYSRIEEVQSNDPMNAEDIAKALEKWRDDWGNASGPGWIALLNAVSPLTQRQGFLPDWDEADGLEGAEVIGWRPYSIYKGNQGVEQRGVALAPTFYRVKKTRPITIAEARRVVNSSYGLTHKEMETLSESTLLDLIKNRGYPTEFIE